MNADETAFDRSIGDMNALTFGEALACLAAAVPGTAALAAYVVLRARGTLCVSSNGWHAGNLRIGRRLCLPALRLFALFQPLMRREACLRAWGRSIVRKRRETVSEVVVELVTIG